MQITRRLIAAYLNCKYKAYLQANGRTGTPHDLETVLAELHAAYRDQAVAVLIHKCCKAPRPAPSAFTNINIHSGQEIILGPTLEDGQAAFDFDALRRTDGDSSLGPFHYSPVLFWQGESPGRNQTLVMAAGGIVLSRYQRLQPKTATVVFGTERRARTLHLTHHYKAAQQIIDGLMSVVDGSEAPRLILNDHFALCEFRTACRQQAIKSDDLSLLGHMTTKKIAHYAQTGTLTVTQLSYTYHARRHKIAHPKQNPRSLPLHALAIRQKRILVVGKPIFPKSAVRIFFDAEGDFDRKFTYLLGLLIVKDGHEEMISLWADDPSQQKRLFEQFVDVLKQHDGYALFHYGQYEAEILRKMRAAVRPKKAVDAAIAVSVNVLTPLHSDVYFPTYSNGLKDIGKYLGFSWTDVNASGLQSLAWRTRWEMTGDDDFKQKLIVYNAEDCLALKRVTETLEAIGQQENEKKASPAWEQVTFESTPRTWGTPDFVLPNLDYINKCAYFNYQHDRVCLRGNPRRRKQPRTAKRRRWLRPTSRVEIAISKCPHCGGRQLKRLKGKGFKKQTFDLEMRPSGMVRRVFEYRAARVRCTQCNRAFYPPTCMKLQTYRHGLKSWAIYQHIQHQISQTKLAALCEDFFHLHLDTGDVHMVKAIMAEYYHPTTELLMQRLLAGNVIHIDETEIKLKHGKGYVWVLTNLEEVVFLYRPNREAGFLKKLLAGFQGVVVSDFFAGYDGLPCSQQKCLIHLIRDMNTDLRKNPFDDELKALIVEFSTILRRIVETIDRRGLTKEWLMKHEPQADSFLDRVCRTEYHSEVAQSYKERFSKYRDKLFVFLEHDGVAWHNNNAEYAIKQFAEYRLIVDGNITERGLNAFLGLLGICVTCKYKGLSFLRFLLSREHDIDIFAAQRGTRRRKHRIELYPKGFPRGYNRRQKYTRKGSEEAANTLGVGPLYTALLVGLKSLATEIHSTVKGVAFLGKRGRARLLLVTLRLDESDSARGLRYVVRLARFAAYCGIARAKVRSAFPAYERVDYQGRTDEYGVGYFKEPADVEKFFSVIANESRRMQSNKQAEEVTETSIQPQVVGG